jgi:hypothetical protein
MTAPAAWPAPGHETIQLNDDEERQVAPARPLSDHEPAHVVIGAIADLLRDIRAGTVTDGCLLGGVTVGFGLEAGPAAQALRAGLAGVVDLGLLGAIAACWLVAVCLLARASRPVGNAVRGLRLVTGAPLDPRPGWVTLPPVGADPEEWTWDRAYLLLGAAQMARYRMRLADTWTYVTGGCFLAWTMLVILGR